MISLSNINHKIGFLGFGNMGGSLARGILADGSFPSSALIIYDPVTPPLSGTRAANSAEEVFQTADTIILAVKPQVFKEAAGPWTELVSGLSGKIVISVMAGIRASRLREVFPAFTVVRVMPNLGLSVGEGATAIAIDGVPEDVLGRTEAIFGIPGTGTTVRVTEEQMDAVTAVSGSGPMYLFEFIDGMTKAGVKAGLARDVAYALALQTAKGSLKLLETSSDSPETWTKRVCSPGGTTLAALGVLQKDGFHGILERAVAAAAARSRELSG